MRAVPQLCPVSTLKQGTAKSGMHTPWQGVCKITWPRFARVSRCIYAPNSCSPVTLEHAKPQHVDCNSTYQRLLAKMHPHAPSKQHAR